MSPNKVPCVVFVDELAEQHSIGFSYLQPMSQNRYCHDHHSDKIELMKGEKCLEECNATIDLNQFTDLSNFRPNSNEIITMPFTIDTPIENRPTVRNNDSNQQGSENPEKQTTTQPDGIAEFSRGSNAEGQWSSLPQSEYANQTPYSVGSHHYVYQMPPAVPYERSTFNNIIYTSVPVGYWPNFNSSIGVPGKQIDLQMLFNHN